MIGVQVYEGDGVEIPPLFTFTPSNDGAYDFAERRRQSDTMFALAEALFLVRHQTVVKPSVSWRTLRCFRFNEVSVIERAAHLWKDRMGVPFVPQYVYASQPSNPFDDAEIAWVEQFKAWAPWAIRRARLYFMACTCIWLILVGGVSFTTVALMRDQFPAAVCCFVGIAIAAFTGGAAGNKIHSCWNPPQPGHLP